jgi:hypothetical protein
MIVHLIVGDDAAKPLREAIVTEESLAGEVVVLQDILHTGPLKRAENQSFGALRSAFWTDVTASAEPVEVPDEERAVAASNALNRSPSAQVWFWMGSIPADVAAYYWLLNYLGQHAGRFFIVNTAGLPFLTAEGKVFFPKSLAGLTPRELIKARKLARPVTPAELEVDGEAWRLLVDENTPLRTLEGGKKLVSRPVSHYDSILLGACSNQFSKASRVITNAITKSAVPTGDTWLGWRLKTLAAEGQLQLRGDVSKSLRDWDVSLPAPTNAEAATPEVA